MIDVPAILDDMLKSMPRTQRTDLIRLVTRQAKHKARHEFSDVVYGEGDEAPAPEVSAVPTTGAIGTPAVPPGLISAPIPLEVAAVSPADDIGTPAIPLVEKAPPDNSKSSLVELSMDES